MTKGFSVTATHVSSSNRHKHVVITENGLTYADKYEICYSNSTRRHTKHLLLTVSSNYITYYACQKTLNCPWAGK